MNPLLSGSATSDLPLIVFGGTSSRSGSLMSQPPRERPPRTEKSSTPRRSDSGHRTTSNREKRNGWTLSAVEPTSLLSGTSRPNNEGTKGRVQVTGPPKPRRLPGETFLPIPTPSPDIQGSPHTVHNRAKLKRWVSVDVTDQIALGGSAKPKQVPLPRSRSLRTDKKEPLTVGDSSFEKDTRLLRVNPLPGPLAEKQRVMNVRRAKKMQQVFGSKPPQALFKVTQVKPISGGESGPSEVFDKRDSVSTLLSISTANLLSPHPHSSRQQRASTSSTIMASTPPLTPILSQSKSVLPRFEQSFAHTTSVTPPAFSNMLPVGTQKVPTSPGTSQSSPRADTNGRRKEKDFRQRRMQAAKLSKFFGVGYQDLEPHLAPGRKRTGVRKVEVAIDKRSGNRHELRSLEMEDVIIRLRDLRAS